MSMSLSTGLQKAVLAGTDIGESKLISDTVSFTASQILDTGKLSAYLPGDFVKVHLGANDHVVAQVISGDADQLTFASGSFAVEAAGSLRMIERLVSSGAIGPVLTNGVIGIFSSPIPISADASEGSAVLLALLTRGGTLDTFTPGLSLYGANFKLNGTILDRAINPSTGVQEVISGGSLLENGETGTATWARHYDNNYTTGASTSAVRMDGTAGDTSGFNYYLPSGRTIGGTAPVILQSINVSIS